MQLGLHVLQEPSQEWDDIVALEKLWLDARGQQTISATPAQQAGRQQAAAGGVFAWN